MRIRQLGVIVAVLGGVCPPAAADRRSSEGGRQPGALGEIAQLLAAQASALERFDADAYLATFVDERREAERRVFLRRRQLPLAEVQMELTRELPSPDAGRREAGPRRARVELRFRLDGQAEDNPFLHTLVYAFVRAGGRWRVDDILDAGARPLPWRRGELVVHRTNHFLICTRPEMRADLVELAADAEAGYAALYRRRLPLDPGYVIYFADGEEFARVSGGLPALGVAVARYATEADRYTVDSRAFYINGALFSQLRRRRLTPERRRVTVTHELAHLALAVQSRPFTPPWLKEGAAVYFSGDLSFDANRRLVRGGLDRLSLAGMTRSHALGGHDRSGRQAADEYLFAGNVVAYLIERRGEERFFELYGSYAEVPPGKVAAHALGAFGAGTLSRVFDSVPGAVAAEITARALRRHYDLTVDELEAEVKHWLSVPHR